MLSIKNYLIFFYIFLFIYMSYSQNIKCEIKYKFNQDYYPYSFIDTNKIVYASLSKNFINIVDLKNKKIIKKIYSKGNILLNNIDILNNKLLFLIDGEYSFGNLCVLDFNTNKIVNISKIFNLSSVEYNFFWDYYGNNEEIIFQHRKILEFNQDNKNIKKQEYYITKKNIKSGNEEIIVNNSFIIDYNNGFLLYLLYDTKNNDDIIVLLNLANSNKTYLKNLPKISINEFGKISDLKNLKIFKNNNFLVINKNQLAIIEINCKRLISPSLIFASKYYHGYL